MWRTALSPQATPAPTSGRPKRTRCGGRLPPRPLPSDNTQWCRVVSPASREGARPVALRAASLQRSVESLGLAPDLAPNRQAERAAFVGNLRVVRRGARAGSVLRPGAARDEVCELWSLGDRQPTPRGASHARIVGTQRRAAKGAKKPARLQVPLYCSAHVGASLSEWSHSDNLSSLPPVCRGSILTYGEGSHMRSGTVAVLLSLGASVLLAQSPEPGVAPGLRPASAESAAAATTRLVLKGGKVLETVGVWVQDPLIVVILPNGRQQAYPRAMVDVPATTAANPGIDLSPRVNGPVGGLALRSDRGRVAAERSTPGPTAVRSRTETDLNARIQQYMTAQPLRVVSEAEKAEMAATTAEWQRLQDQRDALVASQLALQAQLAAIQGARDREARQADLGARYSQLAGQVASLDQRLWNAEQGMSPEYFNYLMDQREATKQQEQAAQQSWQERMQGLTSPPQERPGVRDMPGWPGRPLTNVTPQRRNY